MPTQIKEKVIDPEAELSNAMRTFKTLAPLCSVAKRSEGEPQLQIQEKQISILKHEMHETLLCIRLASQGQHGIRDASIKHDMLKSIVDYESLEAVLRNERAQQSELDLLNYLGNKRLLELLKAVPTDADLQISLEASYNRLRRMENSLDLATTRFCRVNTDNRKIREEIHRLLVERNSFNIQWNNTIDKLIKGRAYLMDIFEIATAAFGARDEICRKLDTLKWRGLYQLNRDIAEMQSYEGELNHLAKLEEFLRMKGTRRICEADEIEEAKRQEEIVRCEQEISKFDALLEDIFSYTGVNRVNKVMSNFNNVEKVNFSLFVLLCQTMQESIYLTKELETLRQKIMDTCDQNEARAEKQDATISKLTQELDVLREYTQNLRNDNLSSENLLLRVYKGIDDLVRLAKCELNPLMKLLGNHKEVRKFNYRRFLTILEIEVKNIIEVVYGAVKPPAPTPRGKGAAPQPPTKIVADPRVELLRPNTIDRLVPYQPCAYCVEDYIMNQVFETPAVPADDEYVQSMFRLEDINTKFGIYTLTIPAKRHPIKTKAE